MPGVSTRVFVWVPVGYARCLDKCVCVGPSWLCQMSRQVCLCGSQLALPDDLETRVCAADLRLRNHNAASWQRLATL